MNKPWWRVSTAGLVTLACLQCAAAQDAVGLKVGEKAPAFTLKDQSGKDVTLTGLLEQGHVALVFYRSADW